MVLCPDIVTDNVYHQHIRNIFSKNMSMFRALFTFLKLLLSVVLICIRLVKYERFTSLASIGYHLQFSNLHISIIMTENSTREM